MFNLIKLWLFCCLQALMVFADDDVGEDYFFEKPLRSFKAKADDCDSLKKLYCKYECGNNEGVCLDDKCYCIYETLLNGNEGKSLVPTIGTVINKQDDNGHNLILQHGLRHHIAHFCPNLDEARKCIRKCMKEGTPAFCGKDHVCYCGHRYSYHQKEKKLDPAKIKARFHDLYEKYFGPGTNLMEEK